MAEEESFPGIDYNQIEGLQRKRLLKFINHFVLQTSHFLSNFSQTCDMKLLNLAKKIQNIETSLSLLEMKLDSVPELKSIPVPKGIEMDSFLAVSIASERAEIKT